jgi:hypothetical protein
MVRWYPYVPVGGEMAVNCAILSYNGTVYFGFSGDVNAAPDLRRLERFLKESFVELREAVRPRRKKSVRPKKGEAKPQVTSSPALKAETVPASILGSVPPDPVVLAEESRHVTEDEKVLAELIA